jgi:hypothetical protein
MGKLSSVIVPGLLFAAAALHAQNVGPKASCASLTMYQAYGVEITKAENVAAGPFSLGPQQPAANLPAHCLVNGIINKRTGADGRQYGIGFEIRLPDSWSERFFFQGGGGMDGLVRPALGTVGILPYPALTRGFATASTDSGHTGANGPGGPSADSSFGVDQQARIDQSYGGFIAVTQLARQMITQYYGQPWKKAYFAGCSNGGRQALLAAQRFPVEFDGIIAEAPAARVGTATIQSIMETIEFTKIAPKNDAGKPILSKAFSNEDLTLVSKAIGEACDAKDGAKDGLVFNTKACKFDPAVLTCKAAKTDSCLSKEQVAALKKVFAGPKNSRGETLYSDWAWDIGIAAPGWRAWKLGTSLTETPNSADTVLMFSGMKGFFMTPPNPQLDPMKYNFDTDPASLHDTNVLQDSLLTYLSTYAARGSKLMMIHGMADPIFSAHDTQRYYERAVQDNGGLDKTFSWMRYYEVPGMNHCQGGPALDQFDALSALVDWVEKNQPPTNMVATGKQFPGVSRPVCAYPSFAQYKGTGSQNDAANFECKTDAGK